MMRAIALAAAIGVSTCAACAPPTPPFQGPPLAPLVTVDDGCRAGVLGRWLVTFHADGTYRLETEIPSASAWTPYRAGSFDAVAVPLGKRWWVEWLNRNGVAVSVTHVQGVTPPTRICGNPI